MNFPKFPQSAMVVGATNVGKTEYLLRILETEYKKHFELIYHHYVSNNFR